MNEKFKLIKKVDLFHYIWLNYFCRNVIRQGTGKIIPYKHAVVEFEQGSKIILKDSEIEIGIERIRGSKKETCIRLRRNAVWNVNGFCGLNCGCTVEVLKDAVLDTEYFTMNFNSTIIAANHITIGNDVMIARNAVIYDSDFHDIVNENYEITNPSAPVVIHDHVWIGTNAMVLKGIEIGRNSIIGAGTVVKTSVGKAMICTEKGCREYRGEWKR